MGFGIMQVLPAIGAAARPQTTVTTRKKVAGPETTVTTDKKTSDVGTTTTTTERKVAGPLVASADENYRRTVSEHSRGRLRDTAAEQKQAAARKLEQFADVQPGALAPSELVQWKGLLEQFESAQKALNNI